MGDVVNMRKCPRCGQTLSSIPSLVIHRRHCKGK